MEYIHIQQLENMASLWWKEKYNDLLIFTELDKFIGYIGAKAITDEKPSQSNHLSLSHKIKVLYPLVAEYIIYIAIIQHANKSLFIFHNFKPS